MLKDFKFHSLQEFSKFKDLYDKVQELYKTKNLHDEAKKQSVELVWENFQLDEPCWHNFNTKKISEQGQKCTYNGELQ